jgi:hypothetical protein
MLLQNGLATLTSKRNLEQQHTPIERDKSQAERASSLDFNLT